MPDRNDAEHSWPLDRLGAHSALRAEIMLMEWASRSAAELA